MQPDHDHRRAPRQTPLRFGWISLALLAMALCGCASIREHFWPSDDSTAEERITNQNFEERYPGKYD